MEVELRDCCYSRTEFVVTTVIIGAGRLGLHLGNLPLFITAPLIGVLHIMNVGEEVVA